MPPTTFNDHETNEDLNDTIHLLIRHESCLMNHKVSHGQRFAGQSNFTELRTEKV